MVTAHEVAKFDSWWDELYKAVIRVDVGEV